MLSFLTNPTQPLDWIVDILCAAGVMTAVHYLALSIPKMEQPDPNAPPPMPRQPRNKRGQFAKK